MEVFRGFQLEGPTMRGSRERTMKRVTLSRASWMLRSSTSSPYSSAARSLAIAATSLLSGMNAQARHRPAPVHAITWLPTPMCMSRQEPSFSSESVRTARESVRTARQDRHRAFCRLNKGPLAASMR